MIQHVVVVGVSGIGKTTVAKALAARMSYDFADADDFHSTANIEKMASGIPLAWSDREPWLDSIREWMEEQASARHPVVMACSALRRSYRDRLRSDSMELMFVQLVMPMDSVRARIQTRADHFMPAALVDSQFEELERLEHGEHGIMLDATEAVEVIVARAARAL